MGWPFRPKEVKDALEILDAEEDHIFSSMGGQIVEEHIKKTILARPGKFADKMKKGTNTREGVYGTIALTAGDFVGSGKYHVYRGILGRVGKDFLKVFNMATDELVQMGSLDVKEGDIA